MGRCCTPSAEGSELGAGPLGRTPQRRFGSVRIIRSWRHTFFQKCAAFFEGAKARPTHRLDFETLRVFTSAKRSTSFKAYVDYNELDMGDDIAMDAAIYACLLSHQDWYVVHSRNIVDVMCATTGRKRWSSSCYHINGVHSEEPFDLLEKGGSVAYLVKEGDVKIQDPYARQLFFHNGRVNGKLYMGLCRTASTIYSGDSSVHKLMKHAVDYITSRKAAFNYEIVDQEHNGANNITFVVNKFPAPGEGIAFFEKCADISTTSITSDRRHITKLVTFLLHSSSPDLVFKIKNLSSKTISREGKWSIVRWFSKNNYKKAEQGVINLVGEIFADLTRPYHRAQVRKQKQDFRRCGFYRERSHALGVNSALLEELLNQGIEVGPWIYMLWPESWEILGLSAAGDAAVHWLVENTLLRNISKRLSLMDEGEPKKRAAQAIGALMCNHSYLLEELPPDHQGYLYVRHQVMDRQTITALTSAWAPGDIVFLFAHLSTRLGRDTSKWFALICAVADVPYIRRATSSTKWKRALHLMAERAPIGEVLGRDAMKFNPTRRFLALTFHRPHLYLA